MESRDASPSRITASSATCAPPRWWGWTAPSTGSACHTSIPPASPPPPPGSSSPITAAFLDVSFWHQRRPSRLQGEEPLIEVICSRRSRLLKLRNRAFWASGRSLLLRRSSASASMAHGWAKLTEDRRASRSCSARSAAPLREATAWLSTFTKILGGWRSSRGLRRGRERPAHRHDACGDVHRAPEVRLSSVDTIGSTKNAAVRPSGTRSISSYRRFGLADLWGAGRLHRPPSRV